MSRGFMIAIFATLLILALGVGGLGYVVLSRPTTAHAEAPEAEAKKEGEQKTVETFDLKLKNFVTDLADKDRQRFVDVTIALGFKDQVTLDAAKKQETRIRHIILSQLRDKNAADLTGASGKEKLVAALMKPLKELLPDLKEIYITDMVVQ